MKQFRVGIIGTGFGAKVHAPQLNAHEGFELVAVSSVTRGNVEEAQKASGVDNIYTDWRLMLENEELDVVVVASAVFLHKEMVEAAYEKGVHVVCEKPMAFNAEETQAMIAARDKAGKLGIVNHEFRFLPARTKVKEILDGASLGNILHIRYTGTFASYTALITRARGWLADESKGGGMLGAIGSHMIDSLKWWTNSHFQELFANLPIHVPVQTDENGRTEHRSADDAFQIIGKLANGATVTLELITAALKPANDYRLEVFGKNGTLVMLDDKEVYLGIDGAALEKVELVPNITAPADMPAISARYYNGFHRTLDALYETLVSGAMHPYLADFEAAHETQKTLDAARLSAKEGKKVKLN